MRLACPLLVVGLMLSLCPVVSAQDAHKPDDWKKMYQDASAKLRVAQDRKAELATENAKLEARVSLLEAQAKATADKVTRLTAQVDELSQETLALRDFYNTWDGFIRANPTDLVQWRAYAGQDLPVLTDDTQLLFDPRWPLEVP